MLFYEQQDNQMYDCESGPFKLNKKTVFVNSIDELRNPDFFSELVYDVLDSFVPELDTMVTKNGQDEIKRFVDHFFTHDMPKEVEHTFHGFTVSITQLLDNIDERMNIGDSTDVLRVSSEDDYGGYYHVSVVRVQ